MQTIYMDYNYLVVFWILFQPYFRIFLVYKQKETMENDFTTLFRK